MRFVFIFFFIISCSYPDIDSVPDFEDLTITEEEYIDLCNLSYLNENDINECIKKIQKETE